MAVKIPQPNQAVLDARQRRAAQAAAREMRIEWFINEVSNKIAVTLRQRMELTTQYLLAKITRNISRPVTKAKGPRGGYVVLDRSKPGEFPKAETTQLMKTLITDVREVTPAVIDGFVGTPLIYGLVLETRMNRSFLVRTLIEERQRITQMLTGPIK